MQKTTLLFGGMMITAFGFGVLTQQHREGYNNTPVLPDQKWRVHDIDRPYPREITPGAVLGAAPSDATVLFDGKDLSNFISNNPSDPAKAVPAKWKVVDSEIETVPGMGNLYTKEKYGDCQFHIEWKENKAVTGNGQGRGNSGVFMMGKFEVQVLDSYKHATYADGQAGGLYGQWPPMVNPIRPPGEWQTYDIIFEAPKFEGEKLVSPAYMTVIFNGVVVHHRQKLNGPTNHAVITPYDIGLTEGRIAFQDHDARQPIHFRNIWVRKLRGYDQP